MSTPEQHSSRPRLVTPFAGVPVIPNERRLRFPLSADETQRRAREALEEDSAFNDVTTIATVLSTRHARATIVARQAGVVAGTPIALEVFRLMDPSVVIRIDAEDGTQVVTGTTLLYITGHARAILSAERVALNFMQRLSGIATLTHRYADAIRGTKARILDTRKTTPGWRSLEKYAVRAGGGVNHRMDLASAVLIKDNHLNAVDGDVALAIRRARDMAAPNATVEVECDRLEQVRDAVDAKADVILLDNMPREMMFEAVQWVNGRAKIEASGGVTLDTVRGIAETGVDFISIGALTHSPDAMDLALDFD